jgi:hypothetical protein
MVPPWVIGDIGKRTIDGVMPFYKDTAAHRDVDAIGIGRDMPCTNSVLDQTHIAWPKGIRGAIVQPGVGPTHQADLPTTIEPPSWQLTA